MQLKQTIDLVFSEQKGYKIVTKILMYFRRCIQLEIWVGTKRL